jgi:hypothetical protein
VLIECVSSLNELVSRACWFRVGENLSGVLTLVHCMVIFACDVVFLVVEVCGPIFVSVG